MFFIINTLTLYSLIQTYTLEINLKKYRNTVLGAVSSAGRALPF